jgi:hypothetical protein
MIFLMGIEYWKCLSFNGLSTGRGAMGTLAGGHIFGKIQDGKNWIGYGMLG